MQQHSFKHMDRVWLTVDIPADRLSIGDRGIVARLGGVLFVRFDRQPRALFHMIKLPGQPCAVDILTLVQRCDPQPAPVAAPQIVPTMDEIHSLLYRHGLVTQTISGDVVITDAGRSITSDMIRRDIETHVEYMRILRHSHPDAARLTLLVNTVKRAASEEGGLDVVEIKLRAIAEIAGGAA